MQIPPGFKKPFINTALTECIAENYFYISQPKHIVCVLREGGSFEHSKNMLRLMG